MRRGSWYFVGLLAVLYIVSYIDRLILALLVEPIKAEIGLSDVQMGLLIGPAFAILYSVIGIPVAWIVDRGNRKALLVVGATLWCLSTIFAGYAHSFQALFLLRMGLALGESVLSPTAMSLIGDLFPPGRRSAPSATFVAAGVSGVALAYVAGAAIIKLAGSDVLDGVPILGGLPPWRLALILVGVPGLVLAVLTLLTTREPVRGLYERPVAVDAVPDGTFGIFGSKGEAIRHYACFFIGNAFLGTMLYGALAWYPTHLIRTQGISASQAGLIFSTALAGAVLLTVAIPVFAERVARAGRRDLLLFIPLLVVPVGVVLFVLALMQSSLLLASIFMAGGFTLLSTINGLPSISIPLTAPAHLRGRLVAVIQFCNNIGGLSVGSFAVAALSQNVYSGPGSLGTALITVAVIAGPIAWILFVFAWLPYRAAMQRTATPAPAVAFG